MTNDETDTGEIVRWKVTNDEGFIPPVSYYESGRVAARAVQRPDRTVTIVWGDRQ